MSRQEEDSEIGGPQVVQEKEQERSHQDVLAAVKTTHFGRIKPEIKWNKILKRKRSPPTLQKKKISS